MKNTSRRQGIRLQRAGMIFGLAFLALGLLGFVPLLTPDDRLFGLFHVNKGHNLIHLVTGIMAIVAALGELQNIRFFFRLFGAAYLAAGILYFSPLEKPMLWLMQDAANAWLHSLIGTTCLLLGFAKVRETRHKSTARGRARLEQQAV